MRTDPLPGLTYVVTDLETTGPVPGEHAMLSFASVACREQVGDCGSFSRNVAPLPGSAMDAQTAAFWRDNEAMYQRTQIDQRDPAEAMQQYVRWVRSLPGDRVFVAQPLAFDGRWMDWYLHRFTDYRLFMGPWEGESLMLGGGIDLPSYAMGVLGWDYRRCRRQDYPQAWLGATAHTHDALDDATQHAHILMSLQRVRAAQPAQQSLPHA